MNGIQSLAPKLRKARKPKYAAGGIPALIKRYASGGDTTSTQIVSNIPAFAQQPYRDLVQSAVDTIQEPNVPYTGDRVATFNDMQEQGFKGVEGLGPTDQSTAAGGLAQTVADKAMGLSYDPSKFTSTLGAGGPGQVTAPTNPAQMTSTQSFTQPGTADQFMNPYMQSVVDIAKRETTRNDDIARTNRNAAAVGAGAFGGSRQAIVEAEAGRNLGQRLNDIQTQGSDAAFKQAQQQFNTEQGLGLQSQMANQSAGLKAGDQSLTAQQANQNAGLTFNQQDLDRQKMEEASRQFGANLGLQGLNTANTAASTLGGIGSDLYKQEQNAATTQVVTGTGQQEQAQKVLDTQYKDFLEQENDPYRKMSFLSDILHGTQGAAQSTTKSEEVAPQSNLQTLAGLGTLLYGATKAKGGTVQRASAIDRGLARIAPDSVGNFAEGGIIGFAAGGESAWEKFNTPPPNRDAGPVRPRTMPPAAAAAAADAEVAAEAAVKKGLLRRVAGVAGPVAATAGVLHTVANPWNSDSSINTDTEEYAKRFGITPSNTVLGDVGIRTAGVADDLMFGIPSALFGPKKYSKNPVPSKDDKLPSITPEEAAKAGAGGSASIKGGAQVTADKPLTMDQLKAARKDAGTSLEEVEKEGIAGIKDVAGLEKADAEKAAKETRERIAKQGIYGEEREKKMQGRLDEMPGREKQNEKDAYINAGLAILMAPPGGKGWRGAIAPIAAGAGVGLKGLRAGEKELRAEREAIDDKMLTLREARKDRENADAKEISAADRAVARAEIDARKAVVDFSKTMGLKKADQANDLWKEWDKNFDNYLTRKLHAETTNSTNATHVAVANGRGAGGIGGKPMTTTQREAAIDRIADDLRKAPGNLGMSVEQARVIGREIVRREEAGLAPPQSNTGFSMQVTP